MHVELIIDDTRFEMSCNPPVPEEMKSALLRAWIEICLEKYDERVQK
jgi:hypothetical protein